MGTNTVLHNLENQAALESLLISIIAQAPTGSPAPVALYGLIDASTPDVMNSLLAELKPYRASQDPPLNLYDDFDGPDIAATGMRLFALHATEAAVRAACNAAYSSLSLSLIASPVAAPLAGHLRRVREIRLPDLTHVLFRYQDTRVTSSLMPLLKPEQAMNLLGPANAWFVPHACGQAYGWQYAQAIGENDINPLQLTQAQITALDDALFVHTVEQQAKETDTTLLDGMSACAINTLLKQHITQGVAIGVRGRPDLSLFTVLSLQLPKGFEAKTPFAQAIDEAVKKRSSLAAALEKITPSEWQMLGLE